MLQINKRRLEWVGFILCVGIAYIKPVWGFFIGIGYVIVVSIYRAVKRRQEAQNGIAEEEEAIDVAKPVRSNSIPLKKKKKKNPYKK